MEAISLLSALKVPFEIITKGFSIFTDTKERTRTFWVKEVLEPVHSSMSEVHKFYISTLDKAISELKDPKSDIKDIVKFLSESSAETITIRDELQGFRIAASRIDHAPEAVGAYLYACEEYFRSGTTTAISSPMRDLLHKLNKVDSITHLTLSDIDAMANAEIKGHLRTEVLRVMAGMQLFLKDSWPMVVKKYHSSRLSLLHPRARL
jgi:hypothetical protein